MRAGLLGRRLAHSYSPQIHAMLGNTDYQLFEVEPDDLAAFLQSNAFDALNVTVPYKRAVLPHCAALTETAHAVGSVNTIVRLADGTFLGDNTDAGGFDAMLHSLRTDFSEKKALVLGSGGASQAAQYVLRQTGAQVIVISRSGEDNYRNLDRHADARLIVNATPVGMFPDNGSSPIDLRLFPQLEGVLDLIYNPAKTRLLLEAESLRIPYSNGLLMLCEQARLAAERFTGTPIAVEASEAIRKTLAEQMLNIVLIGMPGCGKTRVGREIARISGRAFFDADTEIEARVGMRIPEYFAAHTEAEFRAVESEVLADLGKASGTVIATGGGCVTIPENRDFLRQNGKIYHIERELSQLDRKERPLSLAGSLEEMACVRMPLYRRFADCAISNDASAEAAARRILEAHHEISGN